MEKVTCLKNPLIEKDFPKKWPAHVQIITNDNRTFEATIDHPKGDPENPLSWTEIIFKFRSLTAPVLSSAQQDTIIEQVRDLENMPDICQLMDKMTIDTFTVE